MRFVIQRVSSAKVEVEGSIVTRITVLRRDIFVEMPSVAFFTLYDHL